MKTEAIVRDYRDIREDYRSNDDIMSTEDVRVSRIKEIINTKLSIVDKTLILLYVDCMSYRKLGKRLGLSHMTCRKEIIRIKGIIMNEYESMKKITMNDIQEAADRNAQEYDRMFQKVAAAAFKEGVRWYQLQEEKK